MGAQGAGLYPVAYTAPSAPSGVGLATQILLAVQVFTSVMAVVGDAFTEISLHNDGVPGTAGPFVEGFGALLAAPSALATVIVFIVWFHKARVLSEVLEPNMPRRLGRGWAIGGWFVPVGFCWLPRLVAGDIWVSSRPLGSTAAHERFNRRAGLVSAWWACWCLYWVCAVASVVARLAFGASPSLGQQQASICFSVAVDLVNPAAAVLAILMIRKITTMQQLRILQGPGVGHPYAMQMPAAPGYPQGYPQPQYPVPPQSAPAVAQPYQAVPPLTGPLTPAPADAVPAPVTVPATTPADAPPAPVAAPAPEAVADPAAAAEPVPATLVLTKVPAEAETAAVSDAPAETELAAAAVELGKAEPEAEPREG
ncbi:DUF4328 domain-containing protein [Streptacidiphilus sp. EB129]|uniref:DUF4328 domain-containing protein n=1 Tax=Streptacidiphilus sp. EB129 TaxID=3156262 RepID=UPI003512D0F5